ncbi:uncharacterized protein LOC110255307 isoform X2 [Sus scrofa]|uniref:uncharacterized protein LOC110255307 isoform X2 n=1 Tax=Sus scrofa TaxID=9823 RepID=UPI000A2B62DF|nr:uncharacterized protein LOC110255307 isoform X2 [Sus scrofa]
MPSSPALPVFLLLLSGGAGPAHPVRAPGHRRGRKGSWRPSPCLGPGPLQLPPLSDSCLGSSPPAALWGARSLVYQRSHSPPWDPCVAVLIGLDNAPLRISAQHLPSTFSVHSLEGGCSLPLRAQVGMAGVLVQGILWAPSACMCRFHLPMLAAHGPSLGGSELNLSQPDRVQWLPQTPGSWPACDTRQQRLSAELLWKPSGDLTDSDSDNFEEAEAQSAAMLPFFLFLCHLLSLLFKAFAQAATFLRQGQLPDTGKAGTLVAIQGRGWVCVGSRGSDFSLPQSLAMWSSCSSTYRPLPRRKGSLSVRTLISPSVLSGPSATWGWDNQEKLEPLIRQFICG